MRLTDDELREVLVRAEEIERATQRDSEGNAELEAVIGAAEEIGLSRAAVELALRERRVLAPEPPAAGTLAFARSADDKYYVAEVLSNSKEGVRVRFLRGSEHVVSPDQLKPFAPIPGERIHGNHAAMGMQWQFTVVSYDAAAHQIKLNDRWGTTISLPISEVWIEAPRKQSTFSSKARILLTLGVGAGIGAVVGSIVTALLMR